MVTKSSRNETPGRITKIFNNNCCFITQCHVIFNIFGVLFHNALFCFGPQGTHVGSKSMFTCKLSLLSIC